MRISAMVPPCRRPRSGRVQVLQASVVGRSMASVPAVLGTFWGLYEGQSRRTLPSFVMAILYRGVHHHASQLFRS